MPTPVRALPAVLGRAPVRLRIAGDLPGGYLSRIMQEWPEAVLVDEAADAVLLWDYPAAALDELIRTPAPCWAHTRATGIDPRLLTWVGDGILTNGSGAHGPAIAEHVVAVVLAHYRRLSELDAARAARRWLAGPPMTELRGRTVGVVGTGDLGRSAARLLGAFGVELIGISRRGRPVPEIGETRPVSHLGRALRRCDVVVVTLPLTPRTRGLIGRAELALLPDGAFVVNVGRGEVIDTAALVDELSNGRLGGAALDVFDEEPLPADSPLWQLPHVTISPHCADSTRETDQRCLDGYVAAIRRVRSGALPAPVVDPEHGY